MADVAELLLLLTGDSSGAKRALSDTSKGLSNLDSSSSHTSGVFSKLGHVMVAALEVAASAAVALVGLGGVAVKMATDFQTSQTQLVTGAGESQKNLAMVSSGILAMAGKVGQSAGDLSKGMYLIESAGYHGADGLSVLKASAEGAAVGGAQMATVADAVTTALHDYALPASKAAQVTSALVETVAMGKTNLTDLATSIGKVMPTASALGISLQQVTGAMATMTNAGLSARFAAQHLNTTLLALSAPNAVAAKSMVSVGLSAQQVKNTLDGPGGLSAALTLIEQHVSSTLPKGSVASVTALRNIMGGVTGYSTALMLSGANAKEFQTNVKNIGDRLQGTGGQVQGFSQASHDLGFALNSVKDAAGAAMISFGDKLIPVLTVAADWIGQQLPTAVTIIENAFNWLGDNVLPAVVGALKGLFSWIDQNRGVLLGIGGVLLGVVATGFKALEDGVTFISQHKTVFTGLAIAVAAIFVIGHAKAWATDAISNIGNVLSAVKSAPSMIAKFFGFGSSGSSAASSVATTAEDAAGQRVFVTNWEMMSGGSAGSGVVSGAEGAAGGGGIMGILGTLGGGSAAVGGAIAALVSLPTVMQGIELHAETSLTEAQKLQYAMHINAKQAQALADMMSNPALMNAYQAAQQNYGIVSESTAQQAKYETVLASAMATGAVSTPSQIAQFTALWASGVTNLHTIDAWLAQIGGNMNSAESSSANFASAMGQANAAAGNLGRQAAQSARQSGGGKPTAAGGFFDKPTRLLVGEAGPEVVLNRREFQTMMAGSHGGGDHVEVTVNNPHSNVDVTQAIDQARWLKLMARRGASPSAWPTPA